jgi:uncharacterized membrane protein YccF (DUF307 family)
MGMTCPKCGSDNWRAHSGWEAFFLGVMMAGCGIWLIILIIGIPMVLAGIALMSVAPFGGTVYVCSRCRKAWKADVGAR